MVQNHLVFCMPTKNIPQKSLNEVTTCLKIPIFVGFLNIIHQDYLVCYLNFWQNLKDFCYYFVINYRINELYAPVPII
jgi:hypothetical protein